MTTNLQSQILLNELNTNGVYTAGGVLVPEPVPLTSAFALAVKNASIFNPPVLNYTGDVTGYDFVAGGNDLINNLNKLTSLTITGNVSSAFNNISLKTKNIVITGGLNNSFNRSKVAGSIVVTGNVVFSFNNTFLGKGDLCHSNLTINGNIGVSVSMLLVLQLRAFVLAFPITGTIAQFQTAFNAQVTAIETGVDPIFYSDIATTDGSVNALLNTLVGSNPYTLTVQSQVLHRFAYFTNPSSTPGESFINSVSEYHKVNLSGDVIVNSFTIGIIKTHKFNFLFSNASLVFRNIKISGFARVEAPCNKFAIQDWTPAKDIEFTMANTNILENFLSTNVVTSCIFESDCFRLTGTFGRDPDSSAVFFATSSITAKVIQFDSPFVLPGNVTFAPKDKLTAFELLRVDFPLGAHHVLFAPAQGIFKFKKFIGTGQFTTIVEGGTLQGDELVLDGTSDFVGNTFNPISLDVEKTCLGVNFNMNSYFFNFNSIHGKELIIKNNLANNTFLFSNAGTAAGYVKLQKLIFANGLNFIDRFLRGNVSTFDLCELIIEKCVEPGQSVGTICSLAFNGSTILAEKIIVKGDINYSFNATTIQAKEFIAGNTYYSFANSIVDVDCFKLKTNDNCDALATFNLDTSNSAAVTVLTSLITANSYTYSLPPETTPFDTFFITDNFETGTFDRSNLNLIYHPKFVNLNIKVSQLVPYLASSPTTFPSSQFLVDAIVPNQKFEATVVNGDTVGLLTNAVFSSLKYLKLVGTATVSQVPISILKNLKAIEICTTTPLSSADRKLLHSYGL